MTRMSSRVASARSALARISNWSESAHAACRVAHPPYVGFITRLHPCRFPGLGARKLPSSTNNLLGWVLPPLVIYAVEAHPITPLQDRLSDSAGSNFVS